MKKFVLILSLVMISSVTLSAQNRRGAQCHRHAKQCPTERMEKRVNLLTDQMATTYELSEEQKAKLLILNKEYMQHNRRYDGRKGRRHNDCTQTGMKRRGNTLRENCVNGDGQVCDFAATPMLRKQYRVNKMSREIAEYQKGLKDIFTKKQYKQYEEKLKEALSKFEESFVK